MFTIEINIATGAKKVIPGKLHHPLLDTVYERGATEFTYRIVLHNNKVCLYKLNIGLFDLYYWDFIRTINHFYYA